MIQLKLRYHKILADYFNNKKFFIESNEKKKNNEEFLYQNQRRVNIRKAVELSWQIIQTKCWNEIQLLFVNILFLEAKAEAGMTSDLLKEFKEVNDQIPDNQPFKKILSVLEKAIQQDFDFINSYPTTLFQCLWNSCWWYDNPKPNSNISIKPKSKSINWLKGYGDVKLFELMEHWLAEEQNGNVNFFWLRSLRPPSLPLSSDIKTFQYQGNARGITKFSLSVDNHFAVAGYLNGAVGIWNISERKPFFLLGEHNHYVMSTAISHDGSKAVTTSFSGEVKVWDLIARKELYKINHRSPVSCADFSPDGLKFACGDWDGQITIFDSSSGTIIHTLKQHRGILNCMRFSMDSKFIFSCADDYSIRKWDVNNGVEVSRLDNIEDIVNSLYFHPTSNLLVTGNKIGIITIYDCESFKQLLEIDGHEDEVRCVNYSSDGKLIVSGSYDNKVKIWDSITGNLIQSINIHSAPIEDVYFLNDSNYLISGSNDSIIFKMNINHVEDIVPKKLAGIIDSWKFSDSGEELLVRYEDNKIQKWDILKNKILDVGGDEWYECYRQLYETSGYINPKKDFPNLKLYRKGNICELIHRPSGEVITRFPKSFSMITSHSNIPIWAGNNGYDLYVFKLEGLEN
jgi:WD40 repeat protein